MISRRGILKTIGGALLGAFGFAGYAFSIEPGHRLAVSRYKLRPKGWPEGMRLRVACISDIHASEPQMGVERLTEVVRVTNALKPDIILLLGDYGVGQTIYARPVPMPVLSELLKGLQAPLGKFGILGNHDYWGSSLRGWPYTRKKVHDTAQKYRDMLAAADVRLMENDTLRLTHNGFAFWLIGTASLIALPLGARQFESFADLDGQIAKITDDAPAILMAHEPDLFPSVPKRVGLTVCGHTHGGQVRLFGYSPITPSNYGNRFAYGHIVEDERNLVVSGGLGTSVMPLRFGVPPEVVLIEMG